jgi:Sulfotransferase domain
VADLLSKSLTDVQLTQLTEHLRFYNFAKNESVNFSSSKKLGLIEGDGQFIHKEETGDWKNHFGAEFNERSQPARIRFEVCHRTETPGLD